MAAPVPSRRRVSPVLALGLGLALLILLGVTCFASLGGRHPPSQDAVHADFARVQADGRFKINGLEPGRHELVAWHERVGEAKASLVVAAGETTEADFTLPLAD